MIGAMDPAKPNPALYGVPYWSEEFNDMPYRRVGDSGLRASAIGLGTWKFGHPDTGDGARVDERTAHRIFDRAIELGVTFWDTANRYNEASGNSERVIGSWLAANPDQRRNVVLATKLCGGMDGHTPNHCGLSRTNITDALHASLARLGQDYVDVLYFHRLDPDTPIAESLETVEDLISRGLVRYLALSNATVADLRAYAEVLGGASGAPMSRRARPVAVQNKYDPLGREPAAFEGVLAHCASNGIAFVPYSPLAGGLLTERYLDLSNAGQGDRLFDEGLLDRLATAQNVQILRSLAELANRWGVGVSQLTLAYLLTLPGMGPQIPGASSVAQLESNASAGRLHLDEEQRTALAAVFGSDPA